MKIQKRALIVDDEDAAREFLRDLLAAHPEVQIAGEAATVAGAIVQFETLRPDLIFLDVQMPKRDGFSLLPELVPMPDVIFVTAYDCFAVKAFEVNAVDFLVKPIHSERLALSLLRLTRPQKRMAKPFAQDDRIFLYSDHEMRVVAASEITHIKALQNYTSVCLASGKTMLVRRKMAEWQRLLPATIFLRVDRSTIINLPAIKEITPLPRHHTSVQFHESNETAELRLFASRRLRKAVRASCLIEPPGS